jgi:hypothetical protein
VIATDKVHGRSPARLTEFCERETVLTTARMRLEA